MEHSPHEVRASVLFTAGGLQLRRMDAIAPCPQCGGICFSQLELVPDGCQRRSCSSCDPGSMVIPQPRPGEDVPDTSGLVGRMEFE